MSKKLIDMFIKILVDDKMMIETTAIFTSQIKVTAFIQATATSYCFNKSIAIFKFCQFKRK